MNKEIVLYGENQGFIQSYPTLWDAYRGLKEIKKQDKIENITDDYYFQFEYDKEGFHYQREIKIYVRNNKIFYKDYNHYEK